MEDAVVAPEQHATSADENDVVGEEEVSHDVKKGNRNNPTTNEERKPTAAATTTTTSAKYSSATTMEAPVSPKQPTTPETPAGSYNSPALSPIDVSTSPTPQSPSTISNPARNRSNPTTPIRKSGGTLSFMEQFNMQKRKEKEDEKRQEIEAVKKMQSYRKVIAPVRRSAVPEDDDKNNDVGDEKKKSVQDEFDSFDLDAFYLRQRKIESMAKTKQKETIQRNQSYRRVMSSPKRLTQRQGLDYVNDGKADEDTSKSAKAAVTSIDVQDFYLQRKKSNEERRKKEMLAKKHANTRRNIRIPDSFVDEDSSETERKDFTPVIDARSMGLKNKSFSQRLLADEKLKKTNLAAVFVDDDDNAEEVPKLNTRTTKDSSSEQHIASALAMPLLANSEGSTAIPSSLLVTMKSNSIGAEESSSHVATATTSIEENIPERREAKEIEPASLDYAPISDNMEGMPGTVVGNLKVKEDIVPPLPDKCMPQAASKRTNKDYWKHTLSGKFDNVASAGAISQSIETALPSGSTGTYSHSDHPRGEKSNEKRVFPLEVSSSAADPAQSDVSQNRKSTKVIARHSQTENKQLPSSSPETSEIIRLDDGRAKKQLESQGDKVGNIAKSNNVTDTTSVHIREEPQTGEDMSKLVAINCNRVYGDDRWIDKTHNSSAVVHEAIIVPTGNEIKDFNSRSVKQKQSIFRSSRSCKVAVIVVCIVTVILVIIGTTVLSNSSNSEISTSSVGISIPTAVPTLYPTNSPSVSPSSVPSLMPSTFATRYLALQREVLYTFFNTANGEYWTNSDHWLSDDDGAGTTVCSWFGITCTDEGFVNGIKVSDNNVSGPALVSELGLLGPTLENLQLNGNDITGSIPSEIGLLSSVTRFYMHYATLTGTIPTEMGAMESLTHLIFDFNYLTGTIPSEMGKLINLKRLDLAYNLLTSTIPTELGELSNLTTVYCQNNMLTGVIPDEVCDLRQNSSDTDSEGIKILVLDCRTEIECECCTYCT